VSKPYCAPKRDSEVCSTTADSGDSRRLFEVDQLESDDWASDDPIDDELEAIIEINAREDAETGRDFDPDADDWDEEDPVGSNVPN
jgi:hypothetical protein